MPVLQESGKCGDGGAKEVEKEGLLISVVTKKARRTERHHPMSKAHGRARSGVRQGLSYSINRVG